MGKFLKLFGTVLGTGAGVLACTFASFAMLIETRFVGRLAWVGFVFWGLLSLVGFRLRRVGRVQAEESEAARYKHALQTVSRQNQGKVTPLDLATALGIDVEQARAYLNMLVGLGAATPELTEQFTQYYQIGGVTAPISSPVFSTPPPPPPPAPIHTAPFDRRKDAE